MSVQVQNGQISAVATPPAAPATAAPTPPQDAAPAPAVRQGPRPTEFARPSAPPPTPPAIKFEEPTSFAADPGDEQPEPAPEPKSDVATSVLPETPTVSPMQQAAAHELYRAARALGFSPAEITAFEHPTQLQAAVAAASRVARSAQPQGPQKAPQAPEQPVEDEFPEAYLKEQGVDDKVIAAVKRGFDAEARAKALEAAVTQRFAQLDQIEHHRQREAYYQQLDNTFSGLGEQYKPVFGDGSGQAMQAGSPELMRRNAVIQIAVQQQQQYQAAGYMPPPFAELVANAASAMFGVTQTETQQANKTAERLRAQNGQFLPRATARETPAPKGDRSAFEYLASKLGQRGIGFESADNDIDSALLK